MGNATTITIDPIYNGPPDSAHGGVASGRMAELVDPRRATVRLHAPIPIATSMTGTASDDGAIAVTADGQRIAAVRPLDAPLAVEHFSRLDPHVVAQAEAGFLDHWGAGQHPFPTCFGCGPGRSDGLGMELRSGAAPGHDVHAASWGPERDGLVPEWLVWAALDCPSGFPAFVGIAPDRARVTGEFAVEIRHPSPATAPTRSSPTSPDRLVARPRRPPRSSTRTAPTWRSPPRSGSRSRWRPREHAGGLTPSVLRRMNPLGA